MQSGKSITHIIKDTTYYNVNKYNTNNVNVKESSISNIERFGLEISEKLGDSKSLNYYYKVCHKLPEHIIRLNLEIALEKGKNPKAYFTYLCQLKINQQNAPSTQLQTT